MMGGPGMMGGGPGMMGGGMMGFGGGMCPMVSGAGTKVDVKKIDKGVRVLSVEDSASLEATAAALQEMRTA